MVSSGDGLPAELDPKEFAPVIYQFSQLLSPDDQLYLPSSVDWYLSQVQLWPNFQSTPSGPPVSPDELPSAGQGAFLKIPDVNALSIRGGDVTSAIAYYHLLSVPGNLTDIQYWLFYPVRGRSTLRIVAQDSELDIDLLAPPGSAYQGPGEYQGDWKHVTVRVNQQSHVVGVYYGQEATGKWCRPTEYEVVLGTQRPVVYAARNTHSCFPQAGKFDQFNTQRPGDGFSLSLLEWTAPGTVWDCSQGLFSLDAGSVPWNQFPGNWGPSQNESVGNYVPSNLPPPFSNQWGRFQTAITEAINGWIINPVKGGVAPANQGPYTNGDR